VLDSRELWLHAWSNGFVVGIDIALLLLLVLCAMQAAVAYRIGSSGVPSVAVASGARVAVLSAYVAWCPWFHLDYDFFPGDVIATARLLDLPMVLANGHTMLALPAYVASDAHSWPS
jgi:hypothetical protein